MLKLGRFTKVKVLFLVLVFVFNFDLFKFSAAILEKGLLSRFYHALLIIVHRRVNTDLLYSRMKKKKS